MGYNCSGKQSERLHCYIINIPGPPSRKSNWSLFVAQCTLHFPSSSLAKWEILRGRFRSGCHLNWLPPEGESPLGRLLPNSACRSTHCCCLLPPPVALHAMSSPQKNVVLTSADFTCDQVKILAVILTNLFLLSCICFEPSSAQPAFVCITIIFF